MAGRPRAAVASSRRSSTKLFHSPQSGQRPSHFELSRPQAWAVPSRTRNSQTVWMTGSGLPLGLEVLEPRELLDEGELPGAGGTVALLADDDLGDPAVLVAGLVLLLPVDEHHDVRILLE